MHSSQFGITFTDSRGPVNSDGPIHCVRSLNRMVRYSVMPLPVLRWCVLAPLGPSSVSGSGELLLICVLALLGPSSVSLYSDSDSVVLGSESGAEMFLVKMQWFLVHKMFLVWIVLLFVWVSNLTSAVIQWFVVLGS